MTLPWAATASMAFFTVSSSPRKDIGLTGFRSASSSYTIGIPVGRFSSMMAASDIPTKNKQKYQTEQHAGQQTEYMDVTNRKSDKT